MCIDVVSVLSIIVGVLSVLVMTLIGWQIYQIINVREFKKEIEKDYENHMRQMMETSFIGVSGVYEISRQLYYAASADVEYGNNNTYRYIHTSLNATMYCAQLKEFDMCNVIVRTLIDDIVNKRNIRLSEKNRSALLSIVPSIPDQKKIELFSKLCEILASIPVVKVS